MTVKRILKWPSKSLIKKCEEVTEFNEELIQLVNNLHDTMKQQNVSPTLPDAAGLAAPQIGVLKRVFVYQLNGKPSCMINPKILEEEGNQFIHEGCLSFPQVFIKVNRPEKVLVEFQDVDGEIHQLRTDGFNARVLIHETEHLDGIVFTKDLSSLRRNMITNRMKKMKRNLKKMERKYHEWSKEQLKQLQQPNPRNDNMDRNSNKNKTEETV